MSVLFLPPSAGAASVPDASETVSGKIRIATSAEATAGTNDLTAMTPAKVKTVVDAAVVGGVQYKGTFDASAPADLSNAEQGDLYIISVAGTYQGQSWAVGDHLLINADMGGTIDPAKIDKVDNTDSVTSVAGRTGAVTLSTADISGLATVASTGAYSDLTGTPSLATVATTGAYSDLSGTPTLATVATTGAYSDLTGTPTLGTAAALDVGTSASNVVQLNGSAQLPAVDGSLLTGITASVAALDDIGDVTITSVQDYAVLKYDSGTTEWIDAPQINYVFTSTTQSLDLKPGVNRVIMAGGASAITLTLGISTLVAGQGAVFSVLSTGSATNTLTIGSTSWNFDQHQGGVFVATGLNTAYMVSTISYDQLQNLPTLGTAAALDVGTSASNVVQLDGSARLPAVDGSQLTNLPSAPVTSVAGRTGAVTLSTADISGLATVATTGAYSDLTGTPTLGTAAALDVGTSASNVVQLNGSAQLPAVDGSLLTGITASVAALNDIGDVSAAAPSNTNVIKYNSTSGDWESGAVAYSEVTGTPTLATVATTGAYSDLTGTPTLATVATTGAYSDLTGTPTLATVATTGAYSDLSGTPTLGTAAALDVGTSANNVVQLNGSAQLPAVDGSLLTGVIASVGNLNDIGDVSAASPSAGDRLVYDGSNWVPVARFEVVTVTTSTTLTVPEEEQLALFTGSGITATLPSISSNSISAGIRYQLKVTDSNYLTVAPTSPETIDGATSYTTAGAKESLTVVCDGSNWRLI